MAEGSSGSIDPSGSGFFDLDLVCEMPTSETPGGTFTPDASTGGDPRELIGAEARAAADIAPPFAEEACFPDSYIPVDPALSSLTTLDGRPLPGIEAWAEPPQAAGTAAQSQRSARDQAEAEAGRARAAREAERQARANEEIRQYEAERARMQETLERFSEWAGRNRLPVLQFSDEAISRLVDRIFAPFEQRASAPNDGFGDFGEETDARPAEPEQRVVTEEKFARYATEPWTVEEPSSDPVSYHDEMSPSGNDDDDEPPMAVSGGFGMPSGETAAQGSGGQQRVAGYDPARGGDVCWLPGMEPAFAGATAGGGSAAFPDYAAYSASSTASGGAQSANGATRIAVLESRSTWVLPFQEGQVWTVQNGSDLIKIKLENGTFLAQRVGYEHRGFEPIESFGFRNFEVSVQTSFRASEGATHALQFVRAVPQFDLGQNIRPNGRPFRIPGSDLVFKVSRTSGPIEISVEGPSSHRIAYLGINDTSVEIGNGLVARRAGRSVVIEAASPSTAATPPSVPAVAQPVSATPSQTVAQTQQRSSATVRLTSVEQTVAIEGRNYIVRPGVNGNGSDVVLVMSTSDGARVSVNPNSQNHFMSGGRRVIVSWDAATGEVTVTESRSSQSGRGPNDNPPAAPAGGGSAGVSSAAPSPSGMRYSAAVDDDSEPLYGVSWGMPLGGAPVSAAAGYVGDVCWAPGLEPVAVGVGASGESGGVRLFDGYSYYAGEGSAVTDMVSRPGSPLPPPAESAGIGTRAMTMARGFGAGFGVMTALNAGLDEVGINNILVVRQFAGAGVFYAGHVATVSATTEMTIAEAAVRPASLAEFARMGGRFTALTPVVHYALTRVGFTRDGLPEGFWGDVAYQGVSIGVTMTADAALMSTFETLGVPVLGEVLAVYGAVVFGYSVLSDMQSWIMPDAIGMESDIRIAQILNGVATCSVGGDLSMRECTQDDWWEARHDIAGAMPQYVSQLTVAEERVHGEMNAEAVEKATMLRTAFTALLAERLSMEAVSYDGSAEPVSTSDRLAAMLRGIIASGLPVRPVLPEYPTVCNAMDDDCDSNFDDPTDWDAYPAYQAAVLSYPGRLAEYERVTSNYNTLKNIITDEENKGRNLSEIRDLFAEAISYREDIRSAEEAYAEFDETLNVFMSEQFEVLAGAETPFGGEAVFPVIGAALAEHGPVVESEKIAMYLMYQPIGETSIGAMAEGMDASADIARQAYMMDQDNGIVELVGDAWAVSPGYIPTADDIYDGRVVALSMDDPLYQQGYSYVMNTEYPAYQFLAKSALISQSHSQA